MSLMRVFEKKKKNSRSIKKCTGQKNRLACMKIEDVLSKFYRLGHRPVSHNVWFLILYKNKSQFPRPLISI